MLVRFAVRDVVKRFKTGDIELEAETERSLINVKSSSLEVTEKQPKKAKKPAAKGKKKKRQAQAKSGKGSKGKKGKKK